MTGIEFEVKGRDEFVLMIGVNPRQPLGQRIRIMPDPGLGGDQWDSVKRNSHRLKAYLYGSLISIPMSIEDIRKDIDQIAAEQREKLLGGSWWHSIDLGAGQITPGVHSIDELRGNYARFGLEEDLKGRRVLDVGCWDGFYSFESEKRGASVVSVDCWRPENFLLAKEALGSSAEFHEMSVYELSRELMGAFDIVLFLGVLYHLRHPLLALERICEMTRNTAIIETHVIDSVFPTDHPVMEFYEFDQLGGQYDNWWGPNIECLTQMTRSAGFAQIEILRREPTRATIRAYRTWADKPLNVSSTLRIRQIFNAVTIGKFYPTRGRHAFVAILVEGLPVSARRWELRVEIGGYGVHPIYLGPSGDPKHSGLMQINVPVPAGLDPGETTLRLWHEGELSQDVGLILEQGTDW